MSDCPGVMFVLESFRRHMDNGRWLFQLGMESMGWLSAGAGVPEPGIDSTDVAQVIDEHKPAAAIFWPRYEWDHNQWVGPEVQPEHEFRNIEALFDHPEILRIAVFHDAASARKQQKAWHDELQPDVYLVWYHPRSIAPYAPHVPVERMLRTYHIVNDRCIDWEIPLHEPKGICLISGACSGCYPLRIKAIEWAKHGKLGPGVDVLEHPGYGQTGSVSADYVQTLSQYRVALCTASVYGFALRKIFEATLVGCRVITDLPEYDRLPMIDKNLVRIDDFEDSRLTLTALNTSIHTAAAEWDSKIQDIFRARAAARYDYTAETARIAGAIEQICRERETTCQPTP